MGKVSTFLTFKDRGEEAVKLYVSLLPNSKILNIERWGPGAPAAEGSLMTAEFILDGQEFKAMDAGPSFSFAQGTSIFVSCETQAEIDRLWDKLTAHGGAPGPCGWLTDAYGLSWQIVPSKLGEMLTDKKSGGNVMQAMLKMSKLDIKALEDAKKAA